MTRQNSSSGASTTVLSCGVEPPALLCSTSRRPNVSSVVRIAAWRLDSSVTSVRMTIAPLPARCAVSSPAAAAMSATTTLAPSRANSTAVARPIPVAAPVMKATVPANRAMQFPLSHQQERTGTAARMYCSVAGRSARLISSMPCSVSVSVPLRPAVQPRRGGLRTPLQLPQVLPQRGPYLLRSCHAALLEQGDNLLHKRADVARPETLPDGEAIA